MNHQIFTMDVEREIKPAVEFAKVLTKQGKIGEFYICGFLVEKYPLDVKLIAKDHIICAHGYYHEDFAKLSNKKAEFIIKKTVQIFKENNLNLKGWRFPGLSYTNYHINLIAKYGLYDSSIRDNVWNSWGKLSFIRNWLRNLSRWIISFPYLYKSNFKEKPWSIADLNDSYFYKKNGRLITHCYNYKNFKYNLFKGSKDE